MAQKSRRRKQAPTYSADTLALRLIGGVALIALGAMIFMAVDLGMKGNIFEGLNRLCRGLCGGLAVLFPAVPIWAGTLVIWSTQRRAPVRPWVFAVLAFIGACTFLVLVTYTSSGDYLTYLKQAWQASDWGSTIRAAYEDCSRNQYSGGAVGSLLAWPLWNYLGTILSTILIFAGTLFSVLMALNLTPSRIRDLVTGQAGRRREQQQEQRVQAEQQQMAWQQNQAMQQQAWQQQQAHIIEQQQMNFGPKQPWPQPQQPVPNNSVENWQDQLTAQQTAIRNSGTHQSAIFGRKAEQPRPEKAHKSRIFGRRNQEEYDGLVGEEIPVQPVSKPASRQTVTGEPITQPATRWATVTREAEEAEEISVGRKPRTGRKQPDPEMSSVNPASYMPPSSRREKDNRAENDKAQPVLQQEKAEEKPAADAVLKPESPEPSGKRVRTGEAGISDTGYKPVKVPNVTEIGKEAWQPKFKNVPEKEKNPPDEEEIWTPVPYNYPPITDLKNPVVSQENTAAEDAMRSRRLEETLASFKVQARVVNVTHGPAISRFELELASGTKVGKVAELEKDIAYGMEATSVRIEAPIPGKSLVGVEVPNRKVAMVTLREVLQSEKMQNAKSLLTVALGKDIAGTPIICDLSKMPHMLIAGATGSGKSVCINAIINSLLYRAGPDEVKMILVDPKVVELQCYNGIPHLLIPVVNDPHKAAAALAWAVAEMMERYDKFAERKVRNLDGYNAALKPHEKPMARIVIIIDELADLMMVCKKDVEEYICRLTQLARAAGIHLIVATQRPSVDVITGLIKANIPSRIAFKTASYVDSRTILDRNGSEQLLGNGDMLYLPTGSFAPTRVQGCFLSDEEVNRIVGHVRSANPSTYDPDILEKLEQLASGASDTGTGADIIGGMSDMTGGDGNLFEQAVEFAIADGQISTSTLQRRLKIGYARAGRLTDEMEERGIVAAKDGSKPRKCLITREEWEEMKKSTEGMA